MSGDEGMKLSADSPLEAESTSDSQGVDLGNRTPVLAIEQIASLASQVPPVKLFVAVLGHEDESTARALRMLEIAFGPIDVVGEVHPFDATDYYEREMGKSLSRRLYGFEKLAASESLVAAKLTAVDFERELAREGRRSVNLDIGYLDHAKVVLASLKGAGQKLHMGLGVWADFVGRWQAGKYQPFEWTFPDFKTGRYDNDLSKLRARLLEQLRALKEEAALKTANAPESH